MRPVMAVLSVALLYVALAYLSLRFLSINGRTSVAWLPAGMALAVVLMYGKHFAWSVLLGQLAFILLGGGSIGPAIAISTGNALAALVGAWLMTRRGQFDPTLPSLQDFGALIVLAGGVASLIAALVGVATTLVFGRPVQADLLQNLLSWWVGDLVGILLVTPLFLIWCRPPAGWLQAQIGRAHV